MNSTVSVPLPPELRRGMLPSWADIDTVLLDMDGTLLDRHFDDYFWEQHIPAIFAARHGLAPEEARRQLLATYRTVQNTLQWADLDYWSERLGINLCAEKAAIASRVAVHPGVVEALRLLRRLGKALHLVTNAHPEALRIKMARSGLAPCFLSLLTSTEVGFAKEQPQFWHKLGDHIPHYRERTLFVDDSERVLQEAARYGIGHLLHISAPSSVAAATPSRRFPSLSGFAALLAGGELLPPHSP